MPGFVSHTIMAREVYHKIDSKNVDYDYMTTYSLGGDLSKYAKCRYDSHHKDMDKFIYNMADYIKDNKLISNKKVMGVLYGHICHYVMDKELHPVIRNINKRCIKNNRNHMLIELSYDEYLVNSKREYAKEDILITKKDQNIDNLIEYSYLKTYHTNKVSKYYNFNLWLYKRLKNIYRLFGNKFIKRIQGMNRFLNKNRSITLFDKEIDNAYQNSVSEAITYIKTIDKYLKI